MDRADPTSEGNVTFPVRLISLSLPIEHCTDALAHGPAFGPVPHRCELTGRSGGEKAFEEALLLVVQDMPGIIAE
jgi:hypothetical protein